jgi:FKBP-type peptidyl-prolyl cis-trans isomerase 2
MSQPKDGETVKVHYTGTLADGTQFDSSVGGEPLEFVMGGGQLIPGFEKAVGEMSVGDKSTVTIVADEAYGPRYDELLQEVPRNLLPDSIELVEGLALQGQAPDGHPMRYTVVSFTDENVTLDGNHPLAGKDLTFALELVSID